jgi:AAA15 family ATPase/GTPase
MDKKKHLQYFKVENFKNFRSLELNNIGQFNLIAGDNNTGKTSVLEALLFDDNLSTLNRRLFHVFTERTNTREVKNEFDMYSFFLKKGVDAAKEGIRYFVKYNNPQIMQEYTYKGYRIEDLSPERQVVVKTKMVPAVPNIYAASLQNGSELEVLDLMFSSVAGIYYSPMVFFSQGYGADLIMFYSEFIQKSKDSKQRFLKDLSCFIDDVDDIEIVSSEIKGLSLIYLRIKNMDELVPLSMFGEGVNKLFRILCEIHKVKGGRLVIDEIDAGVHFSRFKRFWNTIILSAVQNDVQLFATTHNLECLRFFKEALEENDMPRFQKDARHFLLERLPNGDIKAFDYNFEQFESAIDLGNELRGGN